MSDPNRLRRAEDQADAILGFYIHLIAFVVVMTILFVINVRSVGDWWVQWPAIGWGLGVLGHWMAVFGRMPRAVVQWRLRKIHQLQGTRQP